MQTFVTDDEENEVPGALENFVAIDKGNCNPRFMSATTHRLPLNKEIAGKCGIPLGVRMQPFADQRCDRGELTIEAVDFGEDGPLRCSRCRGYINVFAKFVEYGRKWECNLCGVQNEVPRGYQCGTDTYGNRRDAADRAELSRGSVEFHVGKDMSGGVLREPIIVFTIDVSNYALTSGLLGVVVKTLKALLPSIPFPERTRVGIVTFHHALHFFDLSAPSGQPTLAAVADVDEPFSPLPLTSWLPTLKDGLPALNALLDELPGMYTPNTVRSGMSAGGAAVQAVLDGLADTGGSVIMICSTIPSVGLGKMKGREKQSYYGTKAETELWRPRPPDSAAPREGGAFFSSVAKTCALKQVSVNILMASSFYTDLGTLGQLPLLTGGDLRFYDGFSGNRPSDCQRLYGDVQRMVTRGGGLEAVMKLRCSTGITPVFNGYHGPFFRASPGSEELLFAAIDADKELALELEHDGTKLSEGKYVYLQLAILYTRRDGRRLIRVHNLSLKIADHLPTIFRHASVGAVVSLLTKRAAKDVLTKPLKDVREDITKRVVEVLYKYRANVAVKSSSGQLILPESLKLLAIYMNALFKSHAFAVNTPSEVRVRADVRASALFKLRAQASAVTLGFLYPRLLVLHPLAEGCGERKELPASGSQAPHSQVTLPVPTWSSAEKLDGDGVYLLHDGQSILVHFGEHISKETAVLFLGQQGAANLLTKPREVNVTLQKNDTSRRVMNMINQIKAMWRFYGQSTPVCVMNGPLKVGFTSKLVEDRTYRSDTSYIEFLCELHKKIQGQMHQS